MSELDRSQREEPEQEPLNLKDGLEKLNQSLILFDRIRKRIHFLRDCMNGIYPDDPEYGD